MGKMSNIPAFVPVPRKRDRHDGWTAGRQRDFLEALAHYGIVSAAAEKVGKSAASAYRLRKAEGGESFDAAWDEALSIGMMRLQDIAMDRAINGVAVPRFYKGEVVGEVRWYDNRLLAFMLRHANPRIFGPHAADEDLARRSEAEEARCEARRLEQLERAEALLAATEAELEELECAGSSTAGLEARTLLHEMEKRRDRLQSVIAQLRQVDTLRAAEASIDQLVASGRFSARNAAHFRSRLGGMGP